MSYPQSNANFDSRFDSRFDPRTDEEHLKYPYTYGWNRDTLRWNILNAFQKPCVDKNKVVIAFEDREKACGYCHNMNIDNAELLGYPVFRA